MREIFSNETRDFQTLKEEFLTKRTSKRYRIVAHYPKQSLYPVNIEIFPTNLCNLRCSFCAYQQESKQQLSPHVFQQLIDDILCSPIKSVTLSGGGEPLLYPNISHYIDKISTIKDVGIITNGSIIPAGFLEVAPKCSWIRFSINQPTAQLFANVTNNNKNLFEKIKNNIRIISELTKNTKTVLGIAIVVQEQMEQDLLFYIMSIDLAAKLGVNQIVFHKLVDGIAHESSPLFIPEMLKSKICNYANEKHIVTNISKAVEHSQSSFQQKKLGETCELYDDNWKIFVTANGEISPCLYRLFNEQNSNKSLGNIEDHESLEDILNSFGSCSSEFSCDYCKSWAMRDILYRLKHNLLVSYPCDPHSNFI